MRKNLTEGRRVASVVVLVIMLLSTCAVLPARADVSAQARVIRLRALNDSSSWAPTGYTAQQILAIIADLQPSMLHRYISGPQNPSALVPVCATCPRMTVAQFLQASESVDNSIVVARLSLNDSDSGTLLPEAQNLRNIQITPRLSWISLDDLDNWIESHSVAQLVSIVAALVAQGWSHIEAGGCGSHLAIPDGLTNFASVCYRSPSFMVSPNSVSSWTSYSSIRFVLATPDFPTDIQILQALGGSAAEAAVFSNAAGNQSQVGYSLIYPIIQGAWDANDTIVRGGPYAGQTLYHEMEDLMNKYNPLGRQTSTSTSFISSTVSSRSSSSIQTSASTSIVSSTSLGSSYSSSSRTSTTTTVGPSTTSTGVGSSTTSTVTFPSGSVGFPLVAIPVGIALVGSVMVILFKGYLPSRSGRKSASVKDRDRV